MFYLFTVHFRSHSNDLPIHSVWQRLFFIRFSFSYFYVKFYKYRCLYFLWNAAIQCSGSILRCVSSANEGLQRESVNVQPRNHGPHQALLVLGQEGFSPHPVPVRRPGPGDGGPIPERRSPLHIRRGDQTWPVSLIQYILIFRVFFFNTYKRTTYEGRWNIKSVTMCF